MARRSDQKQYDVTVKGDYPDSSGMITGPVQKIRDLKYARNPRTTAAFYRNEDASGPCLANARILDVTNNKKDPGYINIEDGSRALRLTRDLRKVFPGYVNGSVVKHEIPCGAGRAGSVYEAFENAWAGDPLSAYGGVVALSEEVDRKTAEAMAEKRLIEWVIAPSYAAEAIDVLSKTGIRLMEVGSFDVPVTGENLEVRDVDGGYLVGGKYETKIVSPEFIEVKIGSPEPEDFDAALLNWIVCGHTKSNSVVVGDAYKAHGIGAGQTSRVDAALIALYKASDRDLGLVVDAVDWASDLNLVGASDAFWPFTDGPELLAKAGVRGCIYPTGSDRDQKVLDAFEDNGMFVMVPRPEPGNDEVIERAFY